MRKRLFVMTAVLIMGLCCACGSDGKRNKKGVTVQDILDQQIGEEEKARKEEKDQLSKQDQLPADSSAESTLINESSSSANEIPTVPASNEVPDEEPVEYSKIDVDLTKMSSTMVYTEVYNMMSDPDKYVGKVVKMKGNSGYYLDESTSKYYFACIIQDATACCSQGIEYVLNRNYKIPLDYPEMDAEITIVGKFDTYVEGDYKYLTLKNAELLELKS